MPVKIYKRGDVYHYRGTVNGCRLRGSTGTGDKKTAQRIAAEAEARQWKSHLDGPGAVLTFAEAAALYRKAQKSNRFLSMVELYWGETLVREITSGAVQIAANELYPRAAGSTKNRHVIVPTQAVINYAAGLELCSPLRVKRFKEIVKVKTPITLEWVTAFMSHANPHLAALACFMFLTGARISEAIDLRWKDVDFREKRALIRQTKIAAERKAHMPEMLIAALAKIEGERTPDGKVFKYSTRFTAEPQWQKAIKRAGLDYLSFHCCRHGFATALLHNGVDPVTVAKLGGWASPQHVFQTYGHANKDDTLTDLISVSRLTQTKIE